MDKKAVYEHLAKIYLDASTKKKKGTKEHKYPRFKNLFFITSLIIVFSLALLLFTFQNKNKLLTHKPAITSQIALVLQPDIVKINFNFGPAKKEIYSINLDKLDLSRFKALGFSVRKANYEDNVVLKVEFANMNKENSEILISDIKSYKWRDCVIALADFKNINNWSTMSSLSFIIEEHDTQGKHSIIYIDNVKLLK